MWDIASCEIFQQISETREGLILAGNCHKSNYKDFSLIVLFGIDLWHSWGNTMIKGILMQIWKSPYMFAFI